MLTHDPTTLHHGEKLPVPIEQRLDGPTAVLDVWRTDLLPLPGIKPWFFGRPDPIPVTMPTTHINILNQAWFNGLKKTKNYTNEWKTVVYGTEVRTLDLPIQKTGVNNHNAPCYFNLPLWNRQREGIALGFAEADPVRDISQLVSPQKLHTTGKCSKSTK